MSWSYQVQVSKDAIEDERAAQHQTSPAGCEQAAADQEAAAARAAVVLATAVGLPADSVVVTMSGHANPDHAPHGGSAPEFIQISVRVAPRPAEETMVEAFRDVAGAPTDT